MTTSILHAFTYFHWYFCFLSQDFVDNTLVSPETASVKQQAKRVTKTDNSPFQDKHCAMSYFWDIYKEVKVTFNLAEKVSFKWRCYYLTHCKCDYKKQWLISFYEKWISVHIHSLEKIWSNQIMFKSIVLRKVS